MSDIVAKIYQQIHHPRSGGAYPDTPIWRYMSFGKFADMVHHGKLFFSRPQSFGDRDKLEGDIGPITESEKDKIAKTGYNDLSYEDCLAAIERTENIIREVLKKEYFINCWHMNDHENALMWDAYCSTSESVCIQCSPNILALRLPDTTWAGKVYYASSDERNQDDFWIRDATARLFCKRSEFQDESEFRFVFQDFGGHQAAQAERMIEAREEFDAPGVAEHREKSVITTEKGAHIYFDNLSFIEKIIIHRNSGSYLFHLVDGMCNHYEKEKRRFNRDIEIVRSGI